MAGGAIAQRQSELASEMNAMQLNLDMLGKSLAKLHDRLQPVLRPVGPSEVTNAKTEAPATALAAAVHGYVIAVKGYTDGIIDLTERIEL